MGAWAGTEACPYNQFNLYLLNPDHSFSRNCRLNILNLGCDIVFNP